MRRILFVTNYASPYRVRFFDELSKFCELTVAYSDRPKDQKHRDKDWFVSADGNYRCVQLGKRVLTVKGKSLCLDILPLLREKFDYILLGGYSSPTEMLAIADLRARKHPYILEVDGGVIRPDKGVKLHVKQFLIRGAQAYFSTGEATTAYLCHYGADRKKTYVYPFTSLNEADLASSPSSPVEKRDLRHELGIGEEKVIVSVGQFIHRKGFDILLDAVPSLQPGVGVYLVGGTPTAEMKQQAENLPGVHFVGFRKKDILAKYYRAADVLAMPTREDIWGLVVNEALAAGLPVVSSDGCVSALELVKNGENGYIFPSGDAGKLAEKLNVALAGDLNAMGKAALERVRPYTLENMARVHMQLLEQLEREEAAR